MTTENQIGMPAIPILTRMGLRPQPIIQIKADRSQEFDLRRIEYNSAIRFKSKLPIPATEWRGGPEGAQ